MQMNLDSASVRDRMVLLETPRHIPLPLRPNSRVRQAATTGSSALIRETIRRGDSWENSVWLLIALSALAGMALALGF